MQLTSPASIGHDRTKLALGVTKSIIVVRIRAFILSPPVMFTALWNCKIVVVNMCCGTRRKNKARIPAQPSCTTFLFPFLPYHIVANFVGKSVATSCAVPSRHTKHQINSGSNPSNSTILAIVDEHRHNVSSVATQSFSGERRP
jgi:hypothetical protein